MFCKYCGIQNSDQSQFCKNCGGSFVFHRQQQQPQNQIISSNEVRLLGVTFSKTLIGVYLFWCLLHISFWLIFLKDHAQKEKFWPFSNRVELEDYDISELLFYCLIPAAIIFLIRYLSTVNLPNQQQSFPISTNQTFNDQSQINQAQYYEPTQSFSEPSIYANYGMRFLASLIDFVIIFIVTSVVWAIFDLPIPPNAKVPFLGVWYVFQNPFGIISNWLYFSIMECSKLQGTIGKLALNIKVTDLNGERVKFGKATGRHFGKLLNSLTLFFGWLMPLWSKKNQGLHDLLAKTLVMKKEKSN